jgi:UDP-N-acetylglucosamine:LPS N-acetylglucosamine transferase
MKLLVVLGEGGHTAELLKLVSLLGNKYRYFYIMPKDDNLSNKKIAIPGPVYRIYRAREKDTKFFDAIIKTFIDGIKSFWIILRVKPHAILSCGPAIAVPVSIVGKILGTHIIFVETGSRVNCLSLTGRIMYRCADLFFVQWPKLKKGRAKAIYAGRLI